ncbi:hypothetical protein PPACK8108_LOCUS13687 [Phakopsora pachyrhizi]|uniref:Uncharacterized protein n=1 Tax=Phakopsora pachyrhizi TaxID=170000 RepID=A0AAV0B704_PHAPC|nr:hypothetical protein PPACK8108_LOCUS13687 [Phakopsora pachyrhizi]
MSDGKALRIETGADVVFKELPSEVIKPEQEIFQRDSDVVKFENERGKIVQNSPCIAKLIAIKSINRLETRYKLLELRMLVTSNQEEDLCLRKGAMVTHQEDWVDEAIRQFQEHKPVMEHQKTEDSSVG